MLDKNKHTNLYKLQPYTNLIAEQRLIFDISRPAEYREYAAKNIEKQKDEWAYYSSRAINAFYGAKGIKNAEQLQKAMQDKDFISDFREFKRQYLKKLGLTDHEIRQRGLLRLENSLVLMRKRASKGIRESKNQTEKNEKIEAAKKLHKDQESLDLKIHNLTKLIDQLQFKEELNDEGRTLLKRNAEGKTILTSLQLISNLEKQLKDPKKTDKTAIKTKIKEEKKKLKPKVEAYIKNKIQPEIKKLENDRTSLSEEIEKEGIITDGKMVELLKQHKEITAKIKRKELALEVENKKLRKDLRKINLIKKTIQALEVKKRAIQSQIQKLQSYENSYKWFMFRHLVSKTNAQNNFKIERRKKIGETVDETIAKVYDRLSENMDNMDGKQKFWAFAGVIALVVYLKKSKSEEAKALANWAKTAALGVFGYMALNRGLVPLATGKDISENLEDWRNKIVGETILAQAFRNKGEKPENFIKRMERFKKAFNVFKETGIPARVILREYYDAKSKDVSTNKDKGEMYVAGLTPKKISPKELYLACKTFFDKYPAKSGKNVKNWDPPIHSKYYNNLSFADHITGSISRDSNIKINRDPVVRFIQEGKRTLKSSGELIAKGFRYAIRTKFGEQTYQTGKSIVNFIETLARGGLWAVDKGGKLAKYVGEMIGTFTNKNLADRVRKSRINKYYLEIRNGTGLGALIPAKHRPEMLKRLRILMRRYKIPKPKATKPRRSTRRSTARTRRRPTPRPTPSPTPSPTSRPVRRRSRP